MDKVFAYRLYGDGAETTGVNSFELLTMLAVCTRHSSAMKTRIVFLGLCITMVCLGRLDSSEQFFDRALGTLGI